MVTTTITQSITAHEALEIADDFVADHLGDLIMPDTPQPITSPLGTAWAVPLLLTSPGWGKVGVVGIIVVDGALGQIVAHTPQTTITANIDQLTATNESSLTSAYQQIRPSQA